MTNPPQRISLSIYSVRYGGSIGVRMLEFSIKERHSTAAIDYVRRNLPNYWPAYYAADIFTEQGNRVARVTTSITAEVKLA